MILFICTAQLFAQTNNNAKFIEQDRAKGLIYKKEFTVGAKITSNGWGITANVGKIINIHKTRIFEFEFNGIKDPKERKQSAQFNLLGNTFGTPKDFYFGKQNEFFNLKVGFGYKYNIAEKAEKSGVALTLAYSAGFSLGLLKPYYLDLAYFTPLNDSTYLVDVRSEKYNADTATGNAQTFLNWYNIVGASGFGKGLSEIKPVPGLYGKVALNFEWGARDNLITALEAGVTADFYYKKVPIMINAPNHFMFWSVFLSFQIGRRS